MVWISSSCTTHLISKAANKRCSWTSVGRTDKLLSEHTHKHTNTHTDRKSSKSVFEWSSGLTRWSPAPGAVLTHARGRAVLTVPAVLNRCPVSAANGVLVITTGLNIHWLLGNGVLRAKWACELMRLFPDTVLKIIQKKNCVSSPAVCLTDSVLSGVLHLPLLVSMLTAWKSVGQSLYWFIFLIPFHSFFFSRLFYVQSQQLTHVGWWSWRCRACSYTSCPRSLGRISLHSGWPRSLDSWCLNGQAARYLQAHGGRGGGGGGGGGGEGEQRDTKKQIEKCKLYW